MLRPSSRAFLRRELECVTHLCRCVTQKRSVRLGNREHTRDHLVPEPRRRLRAGNLQGSISLGVSGTYDGSAFSLQFHPGGVTGELGNGSISVLYGPSLTTVVVTRTSDKQAQGMIDVTQA